MRRGCLAAMGYLIPSERGKCPSLKSSDLFVFLCVALCIGRSMSSFAGCLKPKGCNTAAVYETDGAGTIIYTMEGKGHWTFKVRSWLHEKFLTTFFRIVYYKKIGSLMLRKPLDVEGIYHAKGVDLAERPINIQMLCGNKSQASFQATHDCTLEVKPVDEYPLQIASTCIKIPRDTEVGAWILDPKNLVVDDDRPPADFIVFPELLPCRGIQDNVCGKQAKQTHVMDGRALFGVSFGIIRLHHLADYDAGEKFFCLNITFKVPPSVRAVSQLWGVVGILLEKVNFNPPKCTSPLYITRPGSGHWEPEAVNCYDPDGDDITIRIAMASDRKYFKHSWDVTAVELANMNTSHADVLLVLEIRDISELQYAWSSKCPYLTGYTIIYVSSRPFLDDCDKFEGIKDAALVSTNYHVILYVAVLAVFTVVMVCGVVVLKLVGLTRRRMSLNPLEKTGHAHDRDAD